MKRLPYSIMMERQSESEMHRECHTESQSEDDCEGVGLNEECSIKTSMQCGGASGFVHRYL